MIILLLCAGVLPWLEAAPASAAKGVFDIPAGAASSALEQFASQAGDDARLLYSAAAVEGVQTKAVKGEMTPREALVRMFFGTVLKIVEDRRNGAFTVVKEGDPNAPNPTPPAGRRARDALKKNEIQTPQKPPMKTNRLLAKLAATAALILGPAHAQTTPAPDDETQPVVELSPFLVEASQDTGYQATSTLAGTRLATPIDELGASISIYTKDLLNDIGATDTNELLVFATGMEAAGPGGNFAGANSDINATQVFGEAARVAPQSATRTRGLDAPNFSRGYFQTDIASDSYNTDSVTVLRGPNAVLFGVGSPAGVVETSLLRANPLRNTNKVEMRYGNNDSLRGTLDINRVLIDKKLALRVAALHDREEYNQRPAFQEKKRIYGAITFEPFKSTALRANFESGNTRANRPIIVLPMNSISDAWYEAGRPGYDWTFYDDPSRNPNAQAQVAGGPFHLPLLTPRQFFQQIAYVYPGPNATAAEYAFVGQTRSTTGNAANAVKAQVFQPLVNRDLGHDTLTFPETLNIAELPGTYWTESVLAAFGMTGTQQPGVAPAGIKMQGFTDFSAFDFKNRMLDETSRQGESFHAFNIAFEQRAWHDRLGIELAYDTQRVDRRAKNSAFSTANGSHIRIDPNGTLPNGQPNPGYGRPYVNMMSQANWPERFTERESLRATAYLRYDFKDLNASWGKWLGRHTVTGLYEESATESIAYSYRLAAAGAAADNITSLVSGFARRPNALVYIGDQVIGNQNPLQLEPVRVTLLEPGPALPVPYFVRAGNATDPGAFVNAESSLIEILNNGNASREVIKSRAAVLQSHWLQEHLVTMFGWRRDADYHVAQPLTFSASDPEKAHYGFDDFSFASTPPHNVTADVASYSGVLRWPKQWLRLPAGVDFSVFYNKSENFTPIGGRVNAFGASQPSPEGKSEEYGFNLSAFDGKFSARVNWFETTVKNRTSRPPVYGQATNNAIFQVATFWATEGNDNPQLVAMRNADIELLFSALPDNFRDLYGWRAIEENGVYSVADHVGSLPGSGDTTDFTAKGMELEVVYNPTRNWRIMANVAKQETVESNSLPFLKELIGRMNPVWDQLRTRLRNAYPAGTTEEQARAGQVAGLTFGDWLDSTILVPFNTAIATEGSASAEQRKWRANLVTNYTFRRGSLFGEKLNGWSIGGAVRWQDRIGIGYPTTRNPDQSVNIDIEHPFYAPSETNVDAWIAYQRKIWSDRITWKVQLNVRNLVGNSDPIAIGVQPWGDVSTVRLAPERRWYLTNTFSF